LVFIEAVRALVDGSKSGAYAYHGFGGPFLEEFRVLYDSIPHLKMISVEEDADVHKRQQFHLPCRRIQLVLSRFSDYLAAFSPSEGGDAIWMDYTHLTYEPFSDLMTVLDKTQGVSLIKFTLPAGGKDFADKADEFQQTFANLLSSQSAGPPGTAPAWAALLQEMVQVAAQRALSGLERVYLPLTSFLYSDGTPMYSFTGVSCPSKESGSVANRFSRLPFNAQGWATPTQIAIPILSTKERLKLQCLLPRAGNAGKVLLSRLGYLIGQNSEESEEALSQYARFHRHSPYYMRAVP
jgi:hypothetical protein